MSDYQYRPLPATETLDNIKQSVGRIEAYLRDLRDAVAGNPHDHTQKFDAANADVNVPITIPPSPRSTAFAPITFTLSDLQAMNVGTMQAIPLPPSRGTAIFTVQGPNGELPDPSGTPGATNPNVTDDPAVLKATIGTGGWTATVRPPVSYTNVLKIQVMAEYGLTGDPSTYELDHLVPLCCGGHPTSQQNLWAQRRAGINGAPLKDVTEVLAQHAILAGHISLADAQKGFMTNWYDLHMRLTSNPATMKLMMGLVPPEEEP